MTAKIVKSPQAYELFTSSGFMLADTFVKLGYTKESQAIYSMMMQRMEREASSDTIDTLMPAIPVPPSFELTRQQPQLMQSYCVESPSHADKSLQTR